MKMIKKFPSLELPNEGMQNHLEWSYDKVCICTYITSLR